MKTKLEELEMKRGRYLRFTAYIMKSKKHGIPRTIQRTWKVRCDLAHTKDAERSFMGQAERWRAQQMAKFFPPGTTPPTATQTEITQ